MTEATGADPFKSVHLEVVGVVVGFLWSYIRSETRNEKKWLKQESMTILVAMWCCT